MNRYQSGHVLPSKLIEILDALENVTPHGSNRWMASSPLRSDSTPSLSISLSDDGGRILLNDFGSTSENATEDILEQLGMRFEDLFIKPDTYVRDNAKLIISSDPCKSTLPKQIHKYYTNSVKSGRKGIRELFASKLGLPVNAIDDFEWGYDPTRKAFTIPERNHKGQIIGIHRRTVKGRKIAIKGSKRGLVGLETIKIDRSGRLHICEGFSDAVALYSLGFRNVIGVPSAGVGSEMIRSLIMDGHYSDVVIVSDPKPQEHTAALKLGEAISDLIAHRVITPPDGVDMRGWIIQDGVTAKDIDNLINDTPCSTPRFRLWSMEDIQRLPPREHLIEGVLGIEEFAVLYGPPKSGKSLVALDMCMAVQAGLPWYAGKKSVRQGQVIYVAAEGKAGYKDRVSVSRRRYNLSRSRLNAGAGGMRFIFDQPVLSGKDVNALIAAINAQSCDPDLVVIDTLARTNGGDENSASDMSAYVHGLDSLRRELKCAVLVLHHQPRNNNRMRGSVALDGACDVAIRTERSGEVITLVCEFAKDDPEFDEIYLKMKSVNLSKGRSSIQITRPEPQDIAASKQSKRTKANVTANRIMEALQQLSDQSSDGWVIRQEWVSKTGIKPDTFNNHLRILRKNGHVESRPNRRSKDYRPTQCT